MSQTYRVIEGDTFEIISRKKYGTESEAARIAGANPGVLEPLTVGSLIVVPANLINNNINVSAENNDEVSIIIDSNRFRFWDSVRITRSIDAMDIVEFGAPFDASIPNFRDTFRPFSYKNVLITVGERPLFTGTMISVNPVLNNNQRVISVGCYSLPGVLNDSTAPAASFPLEFNGLTLREIATSLAEPFAISVVFEADPGPIFDRVAIEPTQKVLEFLTELAKQRNLIISSNENGALVFLRSTQSNTVVARLRQAESPLLSVSPAFSSQDFYSHITGIETVVVGSEGSQFTVKNSRLQGVVRPLTFKASDTAGGDIKTAVESKASRMYGSAVTYAVNVATWRDPSGQLWRPNTTVTLLAEDAMIYSDYKFIIRSVEFNKDRKTETATLNLVIPESFSGQVPSTLPWD